jgi:hypothetical protein
MGRMASRSLLFVSSIVLARTKQQTPSKYNIAKAMFDKPKATTTFFSILTLQLNHFITLSGL